MKYKITEISNLEMKVEYEDGSWASIPSVAGYEKVDYLIQIQNMLPTSASEVPVAEHPMKIGDEGVVGEGIPADELAVRLHQCCMHLPPRPQLARLL